jgi:hypothetical protein
MPLFRQKKIYELKATSKQKEALAIVLDMLTETQNTFGRVCELTSTSTGEVIEVEELARVKGILSGLLDNSDWEVEIK